MAVIVTGHSLKLILVLEAWSDLLYWIDGEFYQFQIGKQGQATNLI